MPTSIRLDPKTQLRLSRLAKRRGQTKSQVIREAIEAFDEAQSVGVSSPYEQIRHLIGIADSGGRQLSEASGRKFVEKLRAAQRKTRRGRRSA